MTLTFRSLIYFESIFVYDVRFAACFEGSVSFVDGTERKRRQRVTQGSWPTQLVTGTRWGGAIGGEEWRGLFWAHEVSDQREQ